MDFLLIFLLMCIAYCVIFVAVRGIQDAIKLQKIKKTLDNPNIKRGIDNGNYILRKLEGIDVAQDLRNAASIRKDLGNVDFGDVSRKLQTIAQKMPDLSSIKGKIDNICNTDVLKSFC